MSNHASHSRAVTRQIGIRNIAPHEISREQAIHVANAPLPPNFHIAVNGRPASDSRRLPAPVSHHVPRGLSTGVCHDEPVAPGADLGFGFSRDLSQPIGAGSVQTSFGVTFLLRNSDAWRTC